MSLKELSSAVLALPSNDRAILLRQIAASLPVSSGEDGGADSITEALRRDEEIESGLVDEISHGEFTKRMQDVIR